MSPYKNAKRDLAIVATALMLLASCAQHGELGPGVAEAYEFGSSWGDAEAQEAPWLRLEPLEFYERQHEDGTESGGWEGSYSGFDGCNGFSGVYDVIGDRAGGFDQGVTTENECEGIDTWLSQMTMVQIDGDKLTVYGQEGDEIGHLERNATE